MSQSFSNIVEIIDLASDDSQAETIYIGDTDDEGETKDDSAAVLTDVGANETDTDNTGDNTQTKEPSKESRSDEGKTKDDSAADLTDVVANETDTDDTGDDTPAVAREENIISVHEVLPNFLDLNEVSSSDGDDESHEAYLKNKTTKRAKPERDNKFHGTKRAKTEWHGRDL